MTSIPRLSSLEYELRTFNRAIAIIMLDLTAFALMLVIIKYDFNDSQILTVLDLIIGFAIFGIIMIHIPSNVKKEFVTRGY
jgi:hypothetical protein